MTLFMDEVLAMVLSGCIFHFIGCYLWIMLVFNIDFLMRGTEEEEKGTQAEDWKRKASG